MCKRIQSWENMILSRSGKEVLLKTVVQALPSYAMSVFLLPMGCVRIWNEKWQVSGGGQRLATERVLFRRVGIRW